LATFAAACLALSTGLTGFAQTAPALGSWQAGPDAKGANTYIGRIESPSRSQRVSTGANLLVSGWAADTTAEGWAGISAVEVWSGAKDKGGTKLTTGTVGLSRPDVADALGGFGTAGFNATVPASAMSGMSGSNALFVYIDTPNKGSWYKTVTVNAAAGATLAFPTDPVVGFLRPIDGTIISQKQTNNKYSLYGFALDRNAITDPNNQTLGPANTGISAVNIYIDGMRGDPNAIALGPAGLSAGVLVNNKTTPGPGAPAIIPNKSYVGLGFGPQFVFAQWSIATNPSLFAAEQQHTAYAYATSSITGRTSMAQVTFFVKGGNKVINP
jgi:hypothetical protein